MKILISGSSGLIGSALVPFLADFGYHITAILRKKPKKASSSDIVWDLEEQKITQGSLEGFDVVIHLAGEQISSGRWTAERKKLIYESRIGSTKLLVKELRRLKQPPKLFISASAVAYYGDRGDSWLDEKKRYGHGFLASLCHDWEKAANALKAKGSRVVRLRLGAVLSPDGGFLKRMLLPFQMGLGGRVGSGEQFISWISILDVLKAIRHILFHEEIHGPVNIVSPQPVRNKDFAKILGSVLRRPSSFPLPEAAARLFFGQMAQELLLAGSRVKPVKLIASDYEFIHKDLSAALEELISL